MTKAQKWMKCNAIGYFFFVLMDIMVGSLMIFAYANSYQFHTAMMQEALLKISTSIIFEVLCWFVCWNASRDSSGINAALGLGLLGFLVQIIHNISLIQLYGVKYIFGMIPMVSMALYLSTVLAALKMKHNNAVSKSIQKASQLS